MAARNIVTLQLRMQPRLQVQPTGEPVSWVALGR
jgi:hypothetical protein